MLCSLQLNGLSKVLPRADAEGRRPRRFCLGGQFRIVTIDLEPKEPLDKLAKMKAKYIDRLPAWQHDQAARRAGRSSRATRRRFAASPTRSVSGTRIYRSAREWAHPAALIFLATSGSRDPLRLRDRVSTPR